MPGPRLVFLPPDLADPVRRRNGGPPEPEPGPDLELDLEPEPERLRDDPWIVVALLGIGALLGLIGLGVWKLVELVEHIARGL
jgi:hypothetical protein